MCLVQQAALGMRFGVVLTEANITDLSVPPQRTIHFICTHTISLLNMIAETQPGVLHKQGEAARGSNRNTPALADEGCMPFRLPIILTDQFHYAPLLNACTRCMEP